MSMMADNISGSLDQEDQNEFASPWPRSDVVFIVEGRELHSNKTLLSMVSPVFEAMFEKDFVEKTASKIPLPEKSYTEIVEFFRCIHPHISKEVSEEWLGVLLSLADEYQCQMLTKKCQAFLVASLERCRANTTIKRLDPFLLDIHGNIVLEWLSLTDSFLQDSALLKGLVEVLEPRMRPEILTRCSDFRHLSSKVLRLLFQRYTSEMDTKIRNLQSEVSQLKSEQCTRERKIARLEKEAKKTVHLV